MELALWFWVLIVTATLAGFFVGYFHKSEDFRKHMIACVLGMAAWVVLAFFLPLSRSPVLVAFAGQITWASLVALGIYLGAKHRAYHDRTTSPSSRSQVVFWHD